MIHDCIAVGLADQNLSEKLQLDADHSLEKAIHSVQQNKSVRSQQAIVRGQEDAVKQQKWTESKPKEGSKDITESSRENLQAIGMSKQFNQKCLQKMW